MPQRNCNAVYDRVTERVTDLLAQGVAPWQKPWQAHVGPPRNGATGRYYRGLNVFMLSHAGHDSPYWFTPRQVNAMDAHIRRGERVDWVHFFKPWFPPAKDEPGERLLPGDDDEIRAQRPIFLMKAYRVVNLDQCEGPGVEIFRAEHPQGERDERDNDPIAACEAIVDGMPQRPGIRVSGDRAFYSVQTDAVTVPRREAFLSSEHYYATLFHELTHATGHPSRLNRKTIVDAQPFGTPSYSREELIAEMGAAFLCALAGIDDPTIDNTASYLQGWLNCLKADVKAVVMAGAQAQKAVDFVMGSAGVEQVEARDEAAEAVAA